MDDVGGVTAADIGIVVFLLVSGFLAFVRGFIREVLTIAGLIGAIVAALYGYPYLAPYAEQAVGDSRLANLAAGGGIFIVSLICFMILTGALSGLVSSAQLGAVDRSLGFAFGLVRGAAIICLVWIGISFVWSPDDMPAAIRDAKSRPLVEAGGELLAPLADALKPLVASGTDEKGAVGSTVDGAIKALETEKMLRDLNSPKPKAAESDPSGGYDPAERNDLDRLIENSRAQQ